MDDFSIIFWGMLIVSIILVVLIFWLYAFNRIFGTQGMTVILLLALCIGVGLIAFFKKK